MYFTKEPPALEGETGNDETTDNTCDKNNQDKVEVPVVKVHFAENDTLCTKGVVNTNVKYESVSTGKSPELKQTVTQTASIHIVSRPGIISIPPYDVFQPFLSSKRQWSS